VKLCLIRRQSTVFCRGFSRKFLILGKCSNKLSYVPAAGVAADVVSLYDFLHVVRLGLSLLKMKALAFSVKYYVWCNLKENFLPSIYHRFISISSNAHQFCEAYWELDPFLAARAGADTYHLAWLTVGRPKSGPDIEIKLLISLVCGTKSNVTWWRHLLTFTWWRHLLTFAALTDNFCLLSLRTN
jgi:hypothetical protein